MGNEEQYWNNDKSGMADLNEKSQNNKQLPLWLREGLEKIKQEKQKKETEKPKSTEKKMVNKF